MLSQFTVTDLKQMDYCERIPYYVYCLPGLRVAPTHKMLAGETAGEDEAAREHRRGLRAYGLRAGQRQFDVGLTSERLGLGGVLDMLITQPEGGRPDGGPGGQECIPVDYKHTRWLVDEPSRRARVQVQHNWQVQLMAYALLVEEWQPDCAPVTRGFIYNIEARKAVAVALTDELRGQTLDLLMRVREMVEAERQPAPTLFRSRCEACEYRRICNDV